MDLTGVLRITVSGDTYYLDGLVLNVGLMETEGPVLMPLCELPSTSREIWLYITESSYLDPFELRKLLSLPNLGLYIQHMNPVLSTLLIRCLNVLVQSRDLILPVKLLIKTISEKYKYCQYVIKPLDPLNDDLSLQVYQLFRKDKFKYQQYEAAIQLAIEDLSQKYSLFKVLVIGAGMGNLAESVTKYHADLTVIEKNKTVESLLRQLQQRHGFDLVIDDVRNIDIKHYKMIVSEMIGSFGCNEQFPEVLDHASAEIMIPSSVDTIITAIHTFTDYNGLEPYLNNAIHYPLSEDHCIWLYEYPGNNLLNKRIDIKLRMEVSGVINALKGSFKSVLYGNFEISNNIDSGDYCNSWFPMIFPINPITVDKGDIIELSFRRVSGFGYIWVIAGQLYQYELIKRT